MPVFSIRFDILSTTFNIFEKKTCFPPHIAGFRDCRVCSENRNKQDSTDDIRSILTTRRLDRMEILSHSALYTHNY